MVAYGGWPLDLHPPSGIDATEEMPCRHIHLSSLYGIPLRALHSRNVANLFFAGRNISATHVAFASTRVMATCAVMGQAIGTAAAQAIAARAGTVGDFFSAAEVSQLQQRLLRDDAFLPGVRNTDAADLARSAVVTASHETARGAAAHVIDGATREWISGLGPWADGASHRWESGVLPAWIELSWPALQTVREIHLTFDSGLQRELTLSASDSTTKKVIRGPQPELVSDYEVFLDGRSVLTVKGNLLRKRVHRLGASVQARRLRIQIHATHGLGEAHVFEVRVY